MWLLLQIQLPSMEEQNSCARAVPHCKWPFSSVVAPASEWEHPLPARPLMEAEQPGLGGLEHRQIYVCLNGGLRAVWADAVVHVPGAQGSGPRL